MFSSLMYKHFLEAYSHSILLQQLRLSIQADVNSGVSAQTLLEH